MIAEIRYHEICSSSYEPLALPGIGLAAPAGLVAGHRHRGGPHTFAILDLDVTVAEHEKRLPIDLILLEDSTNDHGF